MGGGEYRRSGTRAAGDHPHPPLPLPQLSPPFDSGTRRGRRLVVVECWDKVRLSVNQPCIRIDTSKILERSSIGFGQVNAFTTE
jgi:hypothetical protein